jgi:hypothetical protein
VPIAQRRAECRRDGDLESANCPAGAHPQDIVRELDHPAALEKLDAFNEAFASAHLPRPLDPDAPLITDCAAHVEHFAGTDRALGEGDPVCY